MVDTMGMLLGVVVHPADIQDRDGARLLLNKLTGRFRELKIISGEMVDMQANWLSGYGSVQAGNWR